MSLTHLGIEYNASAKSAALFNKISFGNLSGSPGCRGTNFCSRWKLQSNVGSLNATLNETNGKSVQFFSCLNKPKIVIMYTYRHKRNDLVDLYKIVYFCMIVSLRQRREYVLEVFVLELHAKLSTVERKNTFYLK